MAAALAVIFAARRPSAATAKQKMETCKFGADDQKLQGAARKKFMAKCMANSDSPRGKPVARGQAAVVQPPDYRAGRLGRAKVTVFQRRKPPKSGASREGPHDDKTQIRHDAGRRRGAGIKRQPARPQQAGKRTIVDSQVHLWKANSPD